MSDHDRPGSKLDRRLHARLHTSFDCGRFLRTAAVWTNCLVAFAFLLSALFRSSKTGKWVVLHRGQN